jgi:hypothetical protein
MGWEKEKARLVGRRAFQREIRVSIGNSSIAPQLMENRRGVFVGEALCLDMGVAEMAEGNRSRGEPSPTGGG